MKLEKTESNSVDDLYKAYKAQPSQENLSSVVEALHPTINYALSSVNANNDPVVKSKALIYTAQAIQKYDPSYGASIPTFVTSHLRQLSRAARQSRNVAQIPERAQHDRFNLYKAEKVFQDKHGREPDLLELADSTGMSVRAIEKVRRMSYVTPSEAQLPDLETDSSAPDFQREAMDYVYHDADYLDRKIIEMKTGYGGNQALEPKDIATTLKLTPSQLSRRSAKLTLKINELERSLREI